MIDYRLSAAALGFGTTGIDGLNANGRAVIDADRIRVPIHATARAVTGLNAAIGGLVTNLRVDGDIAYENGKVATDNLRLRSDRIDATAILLADLAKGTYTGALNGRVNDYQVAGLGRVNLVTDARLVPGRNGAFGVAGHVRVVTRRLDNASVRDQLGGNALIDADVAYDLAGGATVRNLRVSAPSSTSPAAASIGPTGGSASTPPGAPPPMGRSRSTFRARSPSRSRGCARRGRGSARGSPMSRRRSTAHAQAIASAPRAIPIMGRSRPILQCAPAGAADGRHRLGDVRGHRRYGTGGPDCRRALRGDADAAGSGLTGSVRLAAAGSIQRADVDLRAAAARIPGPVPITIGSGTLYATALLTPGKPSLDGQFALAEVRQGTLAIARTQGRVAYDNGRGRVALIARGQAGAPFDIAAQASLAPDRVVANLKGAINGIAVRFAQPAIVTKAGATWMLAPTTIVLPQGQAVVSGSFGAATSVHAVLQRLDLSIVQAFAPGLGLGGSASGTFDYTARGPVPDLRARVDIAGFTRTSSMTVSDPVDIALLATLNQARGEARALIRRGGTTVGRMQARLAPLGAGASLSQRLFAAPLFGRHPL